jgi:hypothetical protein
MAATYEDFVDFTDYNDLTLGEKKQITVWLIAAEQMILDYTDGQWENSRGSAVIADTRQILIVRRYFDNQKGVVSASSDGISESYDPDSAEGLRLTAEDKASLGRIKQISKNFSSIGSHKNFGYTW